MKITEISKDHLPWELLLLADPSRTQVEKYIFQSKTYVLSVDTEIVGVLALHPRNNEVEIMNIAITEKWQGRGLGKQLLIEAKRIAKVMGAKVLLIGTGNSSIHQLALYQKFGFRITSIDQDFFLRNYPEAIIENGIPCRDMIRLSLELN